MDRRKSNNATKVEIKGHHFSSVIEACRFFNICRTTVQSRIVNQGLSLEEAISNKIRKKTAPIMFKPTKKGVDYYLYSFKVGVIS